MIMISPASEKKEASLRGLGQEPLIPSWILCRSVASSQQQPPLSRSLSAATSIPPAPIVVGSNGQTFFRSLCKARGVSNDHNASTAYLLIPEHATHGLVLKCSHPLCVKKGRRFRYCAFCCRPVAQRNFYQRHDHATSTRNLQEHRPAGDEETNKIVVEKEKTIIASQRFLDKKQASSDGRISSIRKRPHSSSPFVEGSAKAKNPRRSDEDGATTKLDGSRNVPKPPTEHREKTPMPLGLGENRPLGLDGESKDIVLKLFSSANTTTGFLAPSRTTMGLQEGTVRSFQSHALDEDEDDLAGLDAVLGDFDQDLSDFNGDWSLHEAEVSFPG